MIESSRSNSRAVSLWMLAILGAPILIYAQTYTFEFVNYDDNLYVYENATVLDGLTLSGVRWAFGAPRVGNYHPVTWLSHQLDVTLFGPSPGAHHAVNLAFHAVNGVLLFLLMRGWTGRLAVSAAVALLFAVHPLHVESVAWVSERKDVLSTFFMLVSLGAYTQYARTGSIAQYVVMLVAFALGLLSKPMLVTLPLLLLLLDYWPLQRMPETSVRRLIVEKLPLFALTAASCVITVVAQHGAGMMRVDNAFPLAVRITNALVSYVAYAFMTAWPANLAPFYPHPAAMPPLWQWLGACVLLVAVSVGVIRLRNRYPYLLVGWAWYVITLIPVIGVVQVGLQLRADRYTYVPLIGLFMMAALGAPELARRLRLRPRALATAFAIVIALFGAMAYVQAGHWRDSETFWKYTIGVRPNNALAHQNLGIHQLTDGTVAEAEANLRRALELSKADPYTYAAVGGPTLNALGAVATAKGDLTQAIRYYEEATESLPENASVHGNYGEALLAAGLLPKAVFELRRAVELDPNHFQAWNALTFALSQHNRPDEAIEAGQRAVGLAPESLDARFNLALAYFQANRMDECMAQIEKCLAVDEAFAPALTLKQQVLDQ